MQALFIAEDLGVKRTYMYPKNRNKQITCTHFGLEIEFDNADQMDDFCAQLMLFTLKGEAQ